MLGAAPLFAYMQFSNGMADARHPPALCAALLAAAPLCAYSCSNAAMNSRWNVLKKCSISARLSSSSSQMFSSPRR